MVCGRAGETYNKNVTAFLIDYGCVIANIQWEDFNGSYRNKDKDRFGNVITSADKALTNGERTVTHAGWGEHLKAYKSLGPSGGNMSANLVDPATGLYHVTWDVIKTPGGQAYDPGSGMVNLDTGEGAHILGIIIEGESDALNLTGKDGGITTSGYIKFPQPTYTGIKDVKQSDKIKISGFPNGILILTDESASGICKVYTVTGEEVLQQSLRPSATTISPLRAGVYIVEVQAGKEKKTQKVYVSCNCGAN